MDAKQSPASREFSAIRGKPFPFCLVCESSESDLFLALEKERYFCCSICEAIFMDPQGLPDREAELARYRLHNNSLDDE